MFLFFTTPDFKYLFFIPRGLTAFQILEIEVYL